MRQRGLKMRDRKELRETIVNYLENDLCFRDYRILPLKLFRKVNRIGVHQVIDDNSMEWDLDSAVHTFCKDGYPTIYIYI
jgi:hypothetical protein